MRLIKSMLLVLFVIAIALFTFQNMGTVNLRFLIWELKIPLSIASIALYVLGAISGGLLFSILKKLSLNDLKKKNGKKY